MVSVLSKRARAADSAPEPPSISSRVKRRKLANDENVEPKCNDTDIRVACDEILDESNLAPSATQSAFERPWGATNPPKDACNPTQSPGKHESEDQVACYLPTPKTPRHRDALSKTVPITPRHRIGLSGRSSNPRTPITPRTPRNAPTTYNCARQLFKRSTDPGKLIGRDKEKNELKQLLEGAIVSRSGRSAYISGPPGTGKSALVGEVCQGFQDDGASKVAYVNCMSVKTSGDIYDKLITKLLPEDIIASGDDAKSQLRSAFVSKTQNGGFIYVVALDEIDHLLTLDLEALYTLFEWSFHRSSRLVVVGIANALDLTDRFLPRLKARNIKPQLLPFLPYTAPQIATVITTKLQSLILHDSAEQSGFVPFVHPAAIQLCSKKIASQSGDLRKAFDIINRTIDLIEAEVKSKYQADSHYSPKSPSKVPLGENPNLATTSPKRTGLFKAPLASLTPLTAPRATIAHVSRASATALSNGTSQRLQTLNLQQRAVLCAIVAHQKVSRNALSSILSTPTKKPRGTPTVERLYEIYCSLCRRENALHPLSVIEFGDVIAGLETQGFVNEDSKPRGLVKISTPSRIGRLGGKRMISTVDEKDVQVFLDGMGGNVLRDLLSENDDWNLV